MLGGISVNQQLQRKTEMATASASSKNTDSTIKSGKLLDKVSETLVLKLNYVSELLKEL